jgi:hypothetical protein
MNFKVDNAEIERRILDAFPIDIREEVINVIKQLPSGKDRSFALSSDNIEQVHVLNSTIIIPCRIYFKKPDLYCFSPQLAEIPIINESDKTKYSIFYCIYSRDDNGYIRQSCLEKIIRLSDPWVPPFVLKLLSEYVIEIIEVVAANVDTLQPKLYSDFISNNLLFVTKMKERIISYWACFFMWKYPKFTDYPGFIVGETLGIWTKKDVRHVRGY